MVHLQVVSPLDTSTQSAQKKVKETHRLNLIVTVLVYITYILLLGWAPSTFKSSRNERQGAQKGQRPEDFMDEEVYYILKIRKLI